MVDTQTFEMDEHQPSPSAPHRALLLWGCKSLNPGEMRPLGPPVAAAERQVDLGRRSELGLALGRDRRLLVVAVSVLVAGSRTVTRMRTDAKVSRGAVTLYVLLSVRRTGTCQ